MTQQPEERAIPQLTLGWRLKMALGHEVSVQQMADHLGVARATLSRWMGDRGKPPARAYIAQWALITGVPFEWLMTGRDSGQNGPDKGGRGGPDITQRYFPPVAEVMLKVRARSHRGGQDSPSVQHLSAA